MKKLKQKVIKVIKINVTQEDIDLGRREDARRCPIARAVLTATKERYRVAVTKRAIEFEFPKNGVLVEASLLPPAARRFIRRFDHEDLVKPFSFQIKAAL